MYLQNIVFIFILFGRQFRLLIACYSELKNKKRAEHSLLPSIMITMDEIYEPLIWVALPLLSCSSAATQVNVRSCWSTPSMSYISASLIIGFIQASSSSLVIMEYVRVYFNVEYSLIFLFWLILVFTVQTSKLIFLTPYMMPADKSEISLYDASWVLGKCRRKAKSDTRREWK